MTRFEYPYSMSYLNQTKWRKDIKSIDWIVNLPWNQFNKIVIQWNTSFSIKDRWMCIANQISWNNFIIFRLKDSHNHHRGWGERERENEKNSSHTPLLKRAVKSTTETLAVGTRKAIPVSFPSKSGITLPTWLKKMNEILLKEKKENHDVTAFAAPVDDGIMFCAAPRPPRQS